MLNFQLTPENIAWRKSVHDFVHAKLISRSDLDQHGHFPFDLYQSAFEAGIITCMIPKEFGGGGKSLLEIMLAVEECSYGDLGFTTSAFVMRLAIAPILLFGTTQQKEKWLKPLTNKLSFASFCFTEPEGSSNLGSRPASTTVKISDEGYILNGIKATISNASVASFFVVFARFSSEDNGLSCFIVPRNAQGVEVSAPYKKMGQRAADTAEIKFTDVNIPKENLLGMHGQGAQIALKSLRHSRVGVGAMAVGVCRRSLDLAKAHCHSRSSGEGKALIYEQDIKFRFAEMEAKIEMLNAFVLRAVWELEHGDQATKFSSSVKLMAGRLAVEITNECLDLHGGLGYLEVGYIEKLVRDAKILQIYEGTEAVQKLLIADSAIRIKTRKQR